MWENLQENSQITDHPEEIEERIGTDREKKRVKLEREERRRKQQIIEYLKMTRRAMQEIDITPSENRG